MFSKHAEHRLAEDHRRPSTVAEQAVVFAVGAHAPALSNTRTGPFSRTTDGVTPVDPLGPHHATQQQRIYTSGLQPSMTEMGTCMLGQRLALAKISIDEGVELEGSENGSQIANRPPVPTAVPLSNTQVVSFSSSDGSSNVTSFDSSTDADILANAVQSAAWNFTSGESLSSATGLEFSSAGTSNQDVSADNSGNLQEGFSRAGATEGCGRVASAVGQCYLAVPGPSTNTLQVPVVGAEAGSQDGFFHSGRRASDGLATRADILQLQQLMKTRGIPELQKELESLPVPADPRHPAEARSRRTDVRHGRSQHQRSFEERSCTAPGRLSPFSSRKLRQAGNVARPRLGALGRSRHPPVSTRSPLAELTTLCRMLPTGGTAADQRSRSPLSSEHQLVQQKFQQLGIDGGSSCQPVAVLPLPASAAGLVRLPVGQTGCHSEHRLVVASATNADVSACRSQDSIHSFTTKESVAPSHLPVGQQASAADDAAATGRRHMVRRTLYRLVHQQTLISSFGEEDIPEVSPVSEQAAGTGYDHAEPQPPNSMDIT